MSVVVGPRTDDAGDALEAAIAVVSVTVALARLAVDTAVRGSRLAWSRSWPMSLARPVLGGGRRTTVAVRAAAFRRLGRLADALIPLTAEAILSRVDVAGLVDRFVDVDYIAAHLDVDAVAARLDVARVVDRVDVEAIAAGLDLNALVEKVDVARVIDRVDLDDIVGRVDIDRAAGRIDLDRIIDRVDVDRVAGRLDLDPVIARADVAGIARYVIEEIDLPELIRSSTASLTTEVVRGVRDQGVDADRAVERIVDRLLLRRRGRRDEEPEARP
jgi:hypothetical protein